MCDHPIVSIEQTERQAEAAFNRGDSRDMHGLNWHATALQVWLAKFDQLAAARHASPALHTAPSGRDRFDSQQMTARKLEVHQQRAASLRTGMLMLELGAGMLAPVEQGQAVKGGAL